MKRHFDFHLNAGRLLPLLLAFFIPFVIMEILVVVQSARVDEKTDTSAAAALLIFLLLLAMFLLSVLLYIPILRRVVSAVSLQGEPFRFQGSAGRFLGLNLLGLLLTGITLGVYGPWYITRVCRYLVGEISFKGQGLRFAGKGGRLLVIMLLTLVCSSSFPSSHWASICRRRTSRSIATSSSGRKSGAAAGRRGFSVSKAPRGRASV